MSVATCGLPYYLGGEEFTDAARLQVQTPRSLEASLDLDVRVRHEVIGLDPERRLVTVRSEAGVGTIRLRCARALAGLPASATVDPRHRLSPRTHPAHHRRRGAAARRRRARKTGVRSSSAGASSASRSRRRCVPRACTSRSSTRRPMSCRRSSRSSHRGWRGRWGGWVSRCAPEWMPRPSPMKHPRTT